MNVSYQGFLGVVGAIAVVSNLYIINKYSNTPLVGVLVYLSFGIYAFQFSGLKQTLAMAFVMMAFDFMMQQKSYMFYITTIIAISFHPTAIVVLPLYILCNSRNTRRIVLIMVIIILITAVLRDRLGLLLMTIYDDSYLGRYENTGTIGSMSILFIILLLYYLIIIKAHRKSVESIDSICLRILMVCLTIQLMSSFAYAFTRVNYFYIQFLPVIFSNIVTSQTLKRTYVDGKVFWITNKKIIQGKSGLVRSQLYI